MREILVDYPVPRGRVHACSNTRSTLLGSSILALRERGHFDRWNGLIDPRARDAILYTPAGVWQPVAISEAHYDACERLALPAEEILAMGNAVARFTQKTVLALTLRLAHETGVTPWMILDQTPRLWARLYQGSAMALVKVGPKDAELHFVGNPLSRFAYWRTGLCGIIHALAEPFATKAYVREKIVARADDHPVAYRVSWA
jgi:hypothetical protein